MRHIGKYYMRFLKKKSLRVLFLDVFAFGILVGLIMLLNSFYAKNFTTLLFLPLIYGIILAAYYSAWKTEFFELYFNGKFSNSIRNFRWAIILNLIFGIVAFCIYYLALVLIFSSLSLEAAYLGLAFCIWLGYEAYYFFNIAQFEVWKRGWNGTRVAYKSFIKSWQKILIGIAANIPILILAYFVLTIANQILFSHYLELYFEKLYMMKIFMGILFYLILLVNKIYIMKIIEEIK